MLENDCRVYRDWTAVTLKICIHTDIVSAAVYVVINYVNI